MEGPGKEGSCPIAAAALLPVTVRAVAVVGIGRQRLAILVEVTIAALHKQVIDGTLDHYITT